MTLVASAPWPSRPDLSHMARVYMGKATTLDALTLASPTGVPDMTAFVLSFVESMAVTVTANTDSEVSPSTKAISAVSSSAALCVSAVANAVTTGGSPVISGTGWTTVSDSGPSGNFREFAVATFLDNAATTTPAGSVSAGSGDHGKGFWVLTIGVTAS
jgi:hypothetical protein